MAEDSENQTPEETPAPAESSPNETTAEATPAVTPEAAAPAPAETETGPAGETPIGYYGGTAIVLLTDGENTSGPDPAELAGLASAATTGRRRETRQKLQLQDGFKVFFIPVK